MRSNNYLAFNENEKCQCITFDDKCKIIGSSDTLFETRRLTIAKIKKEFPFLCGIISHLKDTDQNESPLFFPHIEFEINGYLSICDFTFMKTVDALGIQKFIWMIYDNSVHYKDVISKFKSNKNRVKKIISL